MRSFIIILLSFLCSMGIKAQDDIQSILNSGNNFHKICKQADAYFKEKYPSKSLKELAMGAHRDGKFVKYMRWRSFWKHHLNPDGTLGNIKLPISTLTKNNESPYDTVTWTNISNNNYITGQISMGRTTSLAFHPTDPNTYYVGAAIGGIWKTTDAGTTYTPLGDELPFLAISSIIVDENNPDIIYIAISDHVWYGPSAIGVYKSIDGGSTWSETPLQFEFGDNIRIYWMAEDPNNPSKIFVATANGLYRTDDGFASVSMVNNFDCSEIHFKPGDSNTVYLGTRNGSFYRSLNGGNSFSFIQDFGNNYIRMAVTSQNTNLVYITHGDQLYKSINSGITFGAGITLPESNMVISFSPSNTSELLVGNFEIYKSTNQGNNFTQISQWLGNSGLPLIHVDQRNIFTNNLQNNLVYFCNDGGIYTYNVNNFSFTDLSDGLQITQYYDIAVSQSNSAIVSGGSQDNGSMYRMSNGTWDDLAPTGDGMNTEIDPNNANTIYWEYQLGGMRRHNASNGTNVGISPPGQDGNGAWETPYRLDPSNSQRIICGYDQVYESNNRGNSWTSISGLLAGGSNLDHIAIAKSNGNRIYAVRGSTVYVKDIASNNWTTKAAPSGTISDIEVDPLDMNKIVISYSGYSSGQKVFVSNDAGDNWTNISVNLPNVPVGAIEIYENVTDAYFVGTDAGVYYRDYQLSEWLEYGNIPNTRVDDIELQYQDDLIRIGTHGRGVLEAHIDIQECMPGDPDQDNDGICDLFDICPFLDDNMIAQPCDDGDPLTSGETYSENCKCENGASNINYCSAAGSGGTGSDYISNIQLHDLNNSSGQTGYSDFRTISTTIYQDSVYTLSMTLNFSFAPDEAYAWIDYDKDGVFENSEEIIMSGFNAQHTSTGSFTVPPLASYGATTMRVRNIYDQPGNNDPCNNYFGEVEDYTIYLTEYCLPTKVISKEVFCEMDPIHISAENVINIDSSIMHSGTIMEFESSQCIELGNGVDIKSGSETEIFIGGCN